MLLEEFAAREMVDESGPRQARAPASPNGPFGQVPGGLEVLLNGN